MTPLPLGLLHAAGTGTRVNLGWLPDNETILHQLSDVLACSHQLTQHQQNSNKFDEKCIDCANFQMKLEINSKTQDPGLYIQTTKPS